LLKAICPILCNDTKSENAEKGKGKIKKIMDRKQKYFMVPKKEIVENNYDLNLSTYKEEVYEEVSV
jgi:hypothetical protein